MGHAFFMKSEKALFLWRRQNKVFSYFHAVGSFLVFFLRSRQVFMVFAYFCEVGKISWFLLVFLKLAGFHGICLFSWTWQNFIIFAYLHEVGKISWFLISRSLQILLVFAYFHGFSYFHEIGRFSWSLLIFVKSAKFYDCCLFLWSQQNSVIFAYFCEVGKISWFLLKFLWSRQNFIVFAYFHEVDKISWSLLIFMKSVLIFIK